jgi:hypothetical protein
MFLEKDQWLRLSGFIRPESFPQLPCPYCFENSLSLDSDSVCATESASNSCHLSANKSIKDEQKKILEMGGESTALKLLLIAATVAQGEKVSPGIFTSTLSCYTCGETVVGIGSAIYRIQRNAITPSITIKHEYFCPSIPFFDIPPSVPESIRQELIQAFNYFHSDISTAGFRLRRAIERICAELGYKAKNLHQCIILMAEKYEEEAAWLKTLKLVGNEATHADGVSASDLLDAFAVLPGVLHIFERRNFSKNATEIIQTLNGKFGDVR